MILEFDILENGFDFILNAIKMINDDNEKVSTKYAILNLSSGIELIFKEKLKNEHWSLLFEDVNKAKKIHLSSGDFISANSNTVKIRLQEICGVDLKKIDPKKHLKMLRLIRNKIEHFAINENIESLKGLFANVLFVIIKFINSELDITKFSETQEVLFDQIKEHSIKFEKYAILKLKDIKPKVEKWAYIFECPHCLNETMALADDGLICFFCEAQPDPEKLAQEWEISEPLKCLECDNYSIIEYDKEQLCLNCAENFHNLTRCEDCNETYKPQNAGEEYYCTDCLSRQLENDYYNNYYAH